MSRPLQLTSWNQHLATRFPQLPAPVVAVLALYSFGMILAQLSGLSAVALFLARQFGRPYHAVRKRLSEFYKEAQAKSGARQGQKRRDFDPAACFAPLLRWVLSLWSGRHLALAIDVTNLADRFHVLCVSVLVGGVGIPVAWKALLGGVPEPWGPHWEALLGRLRPAVPDAGWTVLVLSDRGLESPGLFRIVAGLGWHPLMRVKKGGKFRPTGWGRFYYLHELVRRPGAALHAEGVAYTGERLRCTLLACWAAGYAEPWLLLTDLPPESGQAVWYGLRAWVEQGFKVIKGGGWQWQKTRMDDPGRVERLWLVLAVATLWVVALGAADEARDKVRDELRRLEREWGEAEQQARARRECEQRRLRAQREALAARQERLRKRQEAKKRQAAPKRAAKKAEAGGPGGVAGGPPESAPGRAHRLSVRGLAVLKASWERGQSLLPTHLWPEPWPEACHSASTVTEQEFLSQPT